MKKRNAIRLLTLCICFALAGVASLHADAIDFTLTNSAQFAGAAEKITFSASLNNPSLSELFLNGDNYDLDLGLSIDDSGFFTLPASLAAAGQPGDTATTASLFSITLAADLAPGSYSGTFFILGGGVANAFDTLASQQFTITVPPTSSVPEPSTIWMTMLGVPALLRICSLRRRDSSLIQYS